MRPPTTLSVWSLLLRMQWSTVHFISRATSVSYLGQRLLPDMAESTFSFHQFGILLFKGELSESAKGTLQHVA